SWLHSRRGAWPPRPRCPYRLRAGSGLSARRCIVSSSYASHSLRGHCLKLPWIEKARTGHKLAEQSTDEIISVPAFEHGGFLYMSNGALYRPFDSSQSLELYAYRLLPEELFTGSTFSKYHDEQAILEGKRKR